MLLLPIFAALETVLLTVVALAIGFVVNAATAVFIQVVDVVISRFLFLLM